jgi:hypothetical protein
MVLDGVQAIVTIFVGVTLLVSTCTLFSANYPFNILFARRSLIIGSLSDVYELQLYLFPTILKTRAVLSLFQHHISLRIATTLGVHEQVSRVAILDTGGMQLVASAFRTTH